MKSSKKKIKIVVLIVVPIIIIAAGIITLQSMNSKTIKETVYQCIMGETYKYTDKSKLVKESKESDEALIEWEDIEMILDVSPLYNEAGDKIILPVTMSVVLPAKSGQCSKVNYFSTISKVEDKIQINSSKNYLENGFLYDGKNTYVFLEPVELRIGENKVNLSTFSYVTVARDQNVAYYNVEKDEYNYSETGVTIVRAITKNGYEIDLANDCIVQENAEKILMVDPKLLSIYK